MHNSKSIFHVNPHYHVITTLTLDDSMIIYMMNYSHGDNTYLSHLRCSHAWIAKIFWKPYKLHVDPFLLLIITIAH